MSEFVVHFKKKPHDVYIGRPSIYGNPFTDKANSIAEFIVPTSEVIPRYEQWLRSQPELVARVKRELRGKVLGCWCKPKPCHGDVLAKIANEET